MKLETKRLEIVVLNSEQLNLLANNLKQLEKQLDFSYQGESLEGHFLEIIKEQINVTKNDERNYPYHSFWLMIRKSDRVVVGSADFKNVPNEAGEIEIGYGLAKQFEHHGYMTEMVEAMCEWALQQDKVKSVIAETLKENVASQSVLKRCNFSLDRENETFWWRLKK